MSFELIKQQLNRIGKKSWSDLFKSKHGGLTLLTIRLPKYDYFRATMFVEDILSITEHEISFELSDLIAILYDDFLHQVINGTNQTELAKKLMQKRDKYLKPTQSVDSSIRVTDNHIRFVDRELPIKRQWVVKELILKKRAALRGEVLLMDLQNVEPNFTLKIEQVISILVIDFVHEIKQGNNAKVMQAIIRQLIEE